MCIATVLDYRSAKTKQNDKSIELPELRATDDMASGLVEAIANENGDTTITEGVEVSSNNQTGGFGDRGLMKEYFVLH